MTALQWRLDALQKSNERQLAEILSGFEKRITIVGDAAQKDCDEIESCMERKVAIRKEAAKNQRDDIEKCMREMVAALKECAARELGAIDCIDLTEKALLFRLIYSQVSIVLPFEHVKWLLRYYIPSSSNQS